ncbi:MAG TPA: hypothetical protein VJP59_00210 [Gemmatimonadota bacterium]|nr:hypothetical protein [Gemmatimonadota bacterium]
MATQASDLTAAETPTIHTDPAGRILVGAEHPRTVHERIGALSDKATEQLLPNMTVSEGQSIKLVLPRSMPTGATRLTDADIVALNAAGKDDVVTFDGPRALPLADGTFRDLHQVKVTSPAKDGALTVEAVD